MFSFGFLAPVIIGVELLLFGLVSWRRGQRRQSLAWRWWSLAYFASALFMCFSAVEQMANPRTFDLWVALQTAGVLLAVGALVVAVVYSIRENRRESGMQR